MDAAGLRGFESAVSWPADTYCLRTSRRYGSVYGGLRRLIIDIADFRW
jgi:hypothetical protein